MDYWFFFSYAHADDGKFLRRFYKELAEEVRQLIGGSKKELSFLDRDAISHGATWDEILEAGLKTCRVFVPLYSSAYFEAPYCGKEFGAFRERLHNHLKAQGDTIADTLILPVLWSHEANVLETLPASIKGIQYTDDRLEVGYPTEYKAVGVSQLVRMGITPTSLYHDAYWDFVRKFANNLKLAATQLQLPPAGSVTPLEKVASAFSDASKTSKMAAAEGPRYVQFIFVAGKQPELKKAKRVKLDFYGQQGGSDWQPYLDAYPGNAAALAAEVIQALPNGSHYEEVVTADIRKQIEVAASQDKIVVVMVDTWTLQIEEYLNLITPLDNYSSVNCITLIAWNEEDEEASIHKTELETAVSVALTNKVLEQPANFLSDSIKSYHTFKEELVKALTHAQSQVAAIAKIKKSMQFLRLVKASDEAVTNPLP
jgi:FxsC-like protein